MNGASARQISMKRGSVGAAGSPRSSTFALALAFAGSLAAAAPSAFAQAAADAPPPVVAAPDAGVDVTAAADQAQIAYDPLEGFNRGSFGFSMGLDRAVLRPVAHGYMAVTPTPVRHRVSSVVYNLGEPSTTLNDILQGKPKRAGRSSARFLINSTVGVLGLWDVAAKMNLPSHDADFGQTFGRYGVKPGPYLYVPIIGPSNFRDGVGRTLDFFTDPIGLIGGGWRTTFGATRLVVQTVDIRVNADNAFRALDDSVDPYLTARSAYGQHRAAFVREVTGEVQALPDFDDSPAETSPDQTTPTEPTPTSPGTQ